MFLEVISPDKKLFSGEVELIQMPATDGLFELLDNHAPMISALGKGNVRILHKNTKQEERFSINGGIMEVSNNHVIILAD